MGIFDKIFKTERDIAKEEIVEIPWHPLTELKQLEEIEKESQKKTIAIFKHSTRCGISRMVLKRFEKEFKVGEEENLKLYFLDLLSNREISNELAQKYRVQHESPQLIVLQNNKLVHHASHQAIEAGTLKEFE